MTSNISKPKMRYELRGQCNRCGWCCDHEDCEHLVYEGKKATCLIHGNEERPLKCKIFPSAPPIIHKECGFYFLDTWENNRIVKYGRDL